MNNKLKTEILQGAEMVLRAALVAFVGYLASKMPENLFNSSEDVSALIAGGSAAVVAGRHQLAKLLGQ